MNHPCAKCLEDVGDNAVLLKNGTYLCPACYQRAYPHQPNSAKPKRVSISVEGVIAIVAVIGVFVIAYLVFQHVAETRREEERARQQAIELEAKAAVDAAEAAKKAQEQAEIRRLEQIEKDKAAAEAREKAKLEAAAERARIAKQNEDLREKAKLELKIKMEEAAKLQRLKEEKRLAGLAARQAKDNATVAQSRAEEIAGFARIIEDAQKVQTTANGSKQEWIRKATASKTILNIATSQRNSLLNQYHQEFSLKYGSDIDYWRNPSAQASKSTGSGAVVVTADYSKLVQKFDNALKEIQTSEENLRIYTQELAKIDVIVSESRSKIDDANQNLERLKATPAEVGTFNIKTKTTASSAPKGNFKTIFKKDGSKLFAQSIIQTDEEVSFKDESGKMQTLKRADVEKIE